jgi:pyruvate/2-oxoglutarate/acetoin dehydrogenase E1 component
MQEKYGELELLTWAFAKPTIIGQGIGMALRGLRPIAEIQYLDYLLYAIQIISDDQATHNIELAADKSTANNTNKRT